jgi:glycosyltransferase involved in cell wall biosynthesis
MPTESLMQLSPDAGVASRLDDWTTTLLCVGRVAPNKNLLLAIDALAEYRERYDANSRLIIAGGHVFPEYSEAVREHIVSKNLGESVTITGRVTAEQLKGLYLATDVLLVTSEHEGFCVPLVEAMALRVPTVAVANAAIPSTAGPFAKYANANATDLAISINELVNDGSQRELHLKHGSERYRERYQPSVIERRFNDLVSSLCGE